MSGHSINTSDTKLEALNIQSSCYGAVIPWLRGMNRIPANLTWYGDFKATSHTQKTGGKGGGSSNTTYTYSASVVMGLSHGTVAAVQRVWKGKGVTSLSALGLTMFGGAVGQAGWSVLNGRGLETLNYSGLAYVAGQAYDFGDSASIENHSFEVQHVSAYGTVASSPDVDPASATYDLLTHPHQGANFPASLIGDWTDWSNYCVANGLLVSPLLTTQVAASDALQTMADLTNTAIVWSDGKLKMRPYGDAAITANGRTFTPDTTPVYQLNDNCYVKPDNDVPVKRQLKTDVDCFNQVKVKYLDRANGYNPAIAQAQDVTDISANGARPRNQITADWICDGTVARLVAELRKQRDLMVLGTFTFRLSWHYALLEVMDLVTLTDSVLQLLDVPARVIEITEESDEDLSITCEDYPAGVASAPLYAAQGMTGFALNANVGAGSALAPLVFELPGALTTTGLELGIAAAGTDPNWGGCQVWVSYDGTTYRQVADLPQGSRYGTLASDSGSTVVANINAGRQLLSGSAVDVSSLATLCYVAPASGVAGEYIAYQGATLTSAGVYTLDHVARGAYNTTQLGHPAGAGFVRVDDSIARTGALDPSLIGKTVYIKLLSYNIFGAAVQSLADVSATTYTIKGTYYQPANSGIALNADPGCTDLGAWELTDAGIQQLTTTATNAVGLKYFSYAGPGTNKFAWSRETIPLNPARTYRLTANIFAAAGNNRNMYLVVRMFKADGTELVDADTGWGGAFAGYTFGGLPTSDGVWRRYGSDFGANTSQPIPSTAVYCRVGVWFQYSTGGSSAVQQGAQDIRLVDVTDARAASAAAAAAQTTANTAGSNASSALSTLATMRSNGYLDAAEKPSVIKQWQALYNEQAGIVAQANTYGITTERDNYNAAVSALSTYLTGLSPAWDNTTTDTPITPAVDNTKWSDVYLSRQVLLNKIADEAGKRANWDKVSGVTNFRVVAAGLGSTSVPAGVGLYKNGVGAAGYSRSYIMARIRRSDGAVTFAQSYDVYYDVANATALAADLNATSNDSVVVVYTYDEPQGNRLYGSLPAAMYRCGASRAVFGSSQFKNRAAYVLVGIAGCGEGNGAELYQGAVDNDPNAWVDMAFQVIAGNLVGVTANYTPRTLADYSYTGDLNATYGAIFGTNISGTASTGDIGSTAITELATFTGSAGYSNIT